jgi:hypothetical protein
LLNQKALSLTWARVEDYEDRILLPNKQTIRERERNL